MLTTLHRVLEKAEKNKFAIPAFNVTNLETAQAVVGAATIAQSPLIIQTSESAIGYAGHETILALMESVIHSAPKKIPIITHIDHGKHYTIVKKSIELGYKSVHMDASEKPWGENVRLTRKAVKLGHRHKITVQGELGYLLGYEGMTAKNFTRKKLQELMTDPDQAYEFVSATKVDTLAIACGTAHGYFKGAEIIDQPRLKEIKKKVSVPLVLHGGSGVSNADIKKAIAAGIRIINVDTTLRIAFMDSLQDGMRTYSAKKAVNIRKQLGDARAAMQKEAIKIMKLFGSANSVR